MKCPWCGKEFIPKRSWQIYCSAACRIAANRKGKKKERHPEGSQLVLRSFTCLQCGEVVHVYDPKDNRFKFCSVHCEKLYWKHPGKEKKFKIRQFQCHVCGKHVIVTDPLDRRRFYCSETCRQARNKAKRKAIRELQEECVLRDKK